MLLFYEGCNEAEGVAYRMRYHPLIEENCLYQKKPFEFGKGGKKASTTNTTVNLMALQPCFYATSAMESYPKL